MLDLTEDQKSGLIEIRRKLRIANAPFMQQLDSIREAAGVNLESRGRMDARDAEALQRFREWSAGVTDSIRVNNDGARREIRALLDATQLARADSLNREMQADTRSCTAGAASPATGWRAAPSHNAGRVTSVARPRPARGRSIRASTRRLASLLVTSAWLVLLLVSAAIIGTLLVLHRGDAEGSARLANAEIAQLLGRGEEVEQRVAVMQRNWWDYFRVTHGILAATDRRLLFVGAPPAPLLQTEYEPPEYLEVSLPYDQPIAVSFARQFLGTAPGVLLAGTGVRESFAFTSAERERVDSVLAVLSRRQEALRLAGEAERLATEATVAASRRAIYHLVQRGEALDLIARRYGVSPDSIVKWNNLPSTRITAGRRLLVRPGVR